MDSITNSCAVCGTPTTKTCGNCHLVLVGLPFLTMRFLTNDSQSTVSLRAKRPIGLNTRHIADLLLGSPRGSLSGFSKTVFQLSWVRHSRNPVAVTDSSSSYGAMCRLLMSCSYLRTKGRTTTKTSTFCLLVSPLELLAQMHKHTKGKCTLNSRYSFRGSAQRCQDHRMSDNGLHSKH